MISIRNCLTATFIIFNVLLTIFAEAVNGQNANAENFIDRNYWKNAIDLDQKFKSYNSELKGIFSDLGAWQGYSFPETQSENFFFDGPYLLDRQNINPFPGNLKLRAFINNDEVDPKKILLREIAYYPGMLTAIYEAEGFTFTQSLIFIDARSSLVKIECLNGNRSTKSVKLELSGRFDREHIYAQSAFSRGVKIYLSTKGGSVTTRLMDTIQAKARVDSVSFSIASEKIDVEPGAAYPFFFTQTYCTSQSDDVAYKGLKLTPEWQKQFSQNEKRWNNYLKKVFAHDSKWLLEEKYARIAVKSVMTLITNWRSATQDLKHDGIFPSLFGYDGFWAWDSWKHAASCALFDPELGKNSMRAMFDYQNEEGMIADCIFADQKENNFRNTKPPLAAWAAWRLFDVTKDTSFLWEMVHDLYKYHNWWYQYRDHDKNGFCEYGSADGTLEAAKWESGMDNAVRFDSATMLQNSGYAWSLNQESVDLNSYLYFEKTFLVKISEITKAQAGVETDKKSQFLRGQIQEYFYDEFSGYFYDRKLDTNLLIKVKGPEGWIPLWTQVADQNQVKQIVAELNDPQCFSTFVPFPSLCKSNMGFDPVKGYWRGPVWIDQAAFAIEGLRKFGYGKLADEKLKQLLDHAEGLTGSAPLYENYDPMTGKALNSPYFSWTAAHLLMLLCEDQYENGKQK